MEQAETERLPLRPQPKSGPFRNHTKKKNHTVCISRQMYDRPPQSMFLPLQVMYNIMHLTLIAIANFRLGQFMFNVVDYYVNKFEKTLDWCVPNPGSELVDQNIPSQDRPLTWIFFIPALVFLRVFRFVMSAISIIIGKGEVTSQDMKNYVTEVRRYLRSIKILSIKDKNAKQIELEKSRKHLLIWRVIYNIRDILMQTKPHPHCVSLHETTSDNETEVQKSSLRSHTLNLLADIDDDGLAHSDDDLNTEQLLEKYSYIPNTSTNDPDYIPEEEEPKSEVSTSSSEGLSDAEGNQESPKHNGNGHLKLNGITNEMLITNGIHNGYSSATEINDLSKHLFNTESIGQLDDEALRILEDNMVAKILSHFKSSANSDIMQIELTNEETFYSPIGSPIERDYSSEPEKIKTAGNNKSDDEYQQNGASSNCKPKPKSMNEIKQNFQSKNKRRQFQNNKSKNGNNQRKQSSNTSSKTSPVSN